MSIPKVSKEREMKIISVIPMKNQIELLCIETKEIYYFKFHAHQSVQSQLKVGDYFVVRGQRFHVHNKKRNKIQGLSGSLDTNRQLFLFGEV